MYLLTFNYDELYHEQSNRRKVKTKKIKKAKTLNLLTTLSP